jgi:O-antigen ligase
LGDTDGQSVKGESKGMFMEAMREIRDINKERRGGAKILLVLADVLIVLWLFSEAVIAHTTTAQIVMAMTALASLAAALKNKRFFLSYWMLFAVMLIVWNALGILLWSINPHVAGRAVLTHLSNFIFFALVFQYFVHRGDFERIITLYLFAFLAMVLYILVRSEPSSLLSERFGWQIYINANKVGIITTFALAFALYKVINRRFWALLPLLVAVAVELLALSFTALAGAAVVVLLTVLIAWPKYWPLKLLGIFIMAAVALTLLVQLWPLAKWKYDITMAALKTPPQMFGSSIVHRRWLIQFGLDHFSQRPVTGYGSNCFYLLEGQARGNAGTYAHNNFIELLVDGGIVQFVLYYAVTIVALARAFRYKEKGLTMKKMLGVVYVAMLVMEMGMVTCFDRNYLVIPLLLIAAVFPLRQRGGWIAHDFLCVRRKTLGNVEKEKDV